MTILLFANQAQTSTAAPISAIDTQIQVASGTGAIFPQPALGQSVVITLVDAVNSQITEIVSCTNITGDVLTVVRAQEGTIARAWATHTFVVNLMTAETANAFAQIYGLENAVYSASFIDVTAPTATFDDVQLTTGQITTAPVSGNDIANKTYVDAQIGTNYIAGTGLDLTGATFSIADTGVDANTYGTASFVPQVIVNAQGQITSADDVEIQITPSQVTGLGTMATQNANAIAVTGGTAAGVAITGGSVNGTPIGTVTPAQGEFTNLIGQSVAFVSGSITSAPTANIDIANKAYVDSKAAPVYTAGAGLTLSGKQFSVTPTGVTAGNYGSASDVLLTTLNVRGQVTSISATPIAITNNQVSGLGTMSVQDADNVAIIGGSIDNTPIGLTTPAEISATKYDNMSGGTF